MVLESVNPVSYATGPCLMQITREPVEASLQQESKTPLHSVVDWFCRIGNLVPKLGYTTSSFLKEGN